MKDQITRDMLISDVVEKHPLLVELLLDHGIHCVGCGAAAFETLEQGVLGHGFSEQEFADILEELNDAIQDEPTDEKAKKSSSLKVTDLAARKLKEILATKKEMRGFRFRVSPNAEDQTSPLFGLDFENEQLPEDQLVTIQEITFYVSKQDAAYLRNTTIDYVKKGDGYVFKISQR
ncbi:MAG: DUF1858 domain-containing protein [Candidatus Woesearchaeota archaeon]|nr:MAG: DUF1858 domain-containing protein [Candidatus Woesearchaeota archaeon]